MFPSVSEELVEEAGSRFLRIFVSTYKTMRMCKETLSNSMVQDLFWKIDSYSAGQEILHLSGIWEFINIFTNASH
jgi:hypothetical protein